MYDPELDIAKLVSLLCTLSNGDSPRGRKERGAQDPCGLSAVATIGLSRALYAFE